YQCVADPALTAPSESPPPKFCELCPGGGNCQSVGGSCQPPSVPGGYQSSDVVACNDNAQCACPNRCVSSERTVSLTCEQTCASSADCSDPGQICSPGGQCQENDCFVPLACDLGNGLDYPPDAGDGTCFPGPPSGFGLCHAPGF